MAGAWIPPAAMSVSSRVYGADRAAASGSITRKPSIVSELRAQVTDARRRHAGSAVSAASGSHGSDSGGYNVSGSPKGVAAIAWQRSAQAVVGELRSLLNDDRRLTQRVQVRVPNRLPLAPDSSSCPPVCKADCMTHNPHCPQPTLPTTHIALVHMAGHSSPCEALVVSRSGRVARRLTTSRVRTYVRTLTVHLCAVLARLSIQTASTAGNRNAQQRVASLQHELQSVSKAHAGVCRSVLCVHVPRMLHSQPATAHRKSWSCVCVRCCCRAYYRWALPASLRTVESLKRSVQQCKQQVAESARVRRGSCWWSEL